MSEICTNIDEMKKAARAESNNNREYIFLRELEVIIPSDYDATQLMMSETDITKSHNDHVLTVIKDKNGLCMYSCQRKKDHKADEIEIKSVCGVVDLLPGKKYTAKIFMPAKRHRNPEDARAVDFLQWQSQSILSGAQGLSVVWPVIKEMFSKYDALVTMDSRSVIWVCGVGEKNTSDLGGIPHALKPRQCGIEDYYGTFGETWDGDYLLLCICEL